MYDLDMFKIVHPGKIKISSDSPFTERMATLVGGQNPTGCCEGSGLEKKTSVRLSSILLIAPPTLTRDSRPKKIFYKKKEHLFVVLTAGGGLCHSRVTIDIEVRLS
jgi:hypothetical protein